MVTFYSKSVFTQLQEHSFNFMFLFFDSQGKKIINSGLKLFTFLHFFCGYSIISKTMDAYFENPTATQRFWIQSSRRRI